MPASRPRGHRWFVYVARCADGTIYTGIARDVARRIAEHDAGKGARYTRGRGPLSLVAVRRCQSHGEALRVELAVKRLAVKEKALLADTKRFGAIVRAVRRRVAAQAGRVAAQAGRVAAQAGRVAAQAGRVAAQGDARSAQQRKPVE